MYSYTVTTDDPNVLELTLRSRMIGPALAVLIAVSALIAMYAPRPATVPTATVPSSTSSVVPTSPPGAPEDSPQPRPNNTIAWVLAALVLLSGTQRIIIDRERKTCAHWIGLSFGPTYRFGHTSEQAIDDVDRVNCVRVRTRHGRSARGSSPFAYLIGLRSPTVESYQVCRITVRTEARKVAEKLATFFDVELVDSSSGTEVVRDAGTLDESIRERTLREREEGQPAAPTPPATRRSRHVPSATVQRLDIPAIGLVPHNLFCLGGCLVVLGGLVYAVVTLLSGQGSILFLAIFGYMGWSLFPIVVNNILGTEHLEASPSGLTVERRTPLGTTSHHFPANEIEELVISGHYLGPSMTGGKAILVRTDERDLHIAGGLPEDELEWIKGIIIQGLSS